MVGQLNSLMAGDMLRGSNAGLPSSERLAADTKSLDQLKAQAKQSPDRALKAVSQQFESIFMNMMLKSMREATPQDGLFDSEQTKMFTGMLDQQFAQSMSSKGIGLADILYRQLSGNMPVQPQVTGGISKMTSAEIPLAATILSSGKSRPNPAAGVTPQQDFINRMMPNALKVSEASGVPTSLMLGQAALESGWGKNEIRMADGSPSYNLFGIKAGENWNGKVAEVTTTEFQNGVAQKQVEKFRAYSSYAEAFQDHANLLTKNPRYAGVLQSVGDSSGMAQAMQQSGYATDPQYAHKLQRIMAQLNGAGLA